MPVIAFASTKGGSAKTTTAILLATAFAADGLNVALLDADPDAKAGEWYQVWAPATGYNGELAVDPKTEILLDAYSHRGITYQPSVHEDNVHDLVDQYSETHDIVLIDLQGSANMTMAMAVGAADLVIIPVMPSRFDLKAMLRTVKTVRLSGRNARREIPHWILMSNTSTTIHKTKVDRHTRQEAEKLGLYLFDVELGHRVAFSRMTHDGLPPAPDKDAAAAENVGALVREVALVLQGQHHKQRPLAAVNG